MCFCGTQDPVDVPALHRVEAYIGKRLEEQPISSLGVSTSHELRQQPNQAIYVHPE